jgi:hypothetical protein
MTLFGDAKKMCEEIEGARVSEFYCARAHLAQALRSEARQRHNGTSRALSSVLSEFTLEVDRGLRGADHHSSVEL